MQFTFKKKIGDTEFEITESADTHQEFIEKASFFSSLPTTAPNGATDLELVHRKAKTAAGAPCSYYSIISKSENKELKLGQSMQTPGQLFVKGWEEAYNGGSDNQSSGNQAASGGGLGGSVGLGGAQNAAPPAQNNTPPAQNSTPPAQNSAPPAQNNLPPAQNTAPPAQGSTPPAQNNTPPAQNQQSSESYNNIAAKYGLGQ